MFFLKSIIEKTTQYKKSPAINSSFWVAFGMMGTQGLRLLSNILLTRLLVPEYFGMMAIVYSVVGFYSMMSDVGLVPSVVNSNRDNDSRFMSTVWTIQVSCALFLAVLLLISAYPISQVYEESLLFPLLVVIALTSVIGGLNSTALILEQKYLRQKKLVLCQLSTQLVSSLVMVVVAYNTHSIWSLVAGNVVAVIVTLWYSYNIFSPQHSTFRLEAKAVSEIVHFGKWILLSSMLSYAGNRSRPVIMGLWVTMGQLGVYSVAAALATVVEAIVNSLSSKVLHPKYRQCIEKDDFDSIKQLRSKFIVLFLPLTIIVALFGELLVEVLYDDRYKEAGAILQILALGRIGSLFVLVNAPILIAVGDSKGLSFSQGATAAMSFVLVMLGGFYSGFYGMVLAAALIPFANYLAINLVLLKHGFDFVFWDAVTMLLSVCFIVGIWFNFNSSSLLMVAEAFRNDFN